MILNRNQVKLGPLKISLVHLKQENIGVTVTEDKGHHLLIDTKDSREMFLMASLFRYVNDTSDLVYLQRKNPSNADLVIFNGAINPISRKQFRGIKMALHHSTFESFDLPLINDHDESIWDEWQSWKYKDQLRIDADNHLVLLNASRLGLELLEDQCSYLAVSYTGHAHFDWYSTTNSIELIIRNMARND